MKRRLPGPAGRRFTRPGGPPVISPMTATARDHGDRGFVERPDQPIEVFGCDRDQQAARGLGVAQQQAVFLGEGIVPVGRISDAVHVPVGAAGGRARGQQLAGSRKHRNVAQADRGADAAAPHHGGEVAHESEAGDIGAGVYTDLHHGL